jgi:hypothetical protein
MADVVEDELIDLTEFLDEGSCCCEFCQGSYSHELEIVCDDCRQNLCPFCATRHGSRYCCPRCDETRKLANELLRALERE